VDLECIVPAQVRQLTQPGTVGRDHVDLTAAREREQAVLDRRGWAKGPLGALERASHERDSDRGDSQGKRSDEGAVRNAWLLWWAADFPVFDIRPKVRRGELVERP
jgi:hypothetical protein